MDFSQDLPAKELERLLKGGMIRHGAHPILKWHASNVVVDIDKAGNYSRSTNEEPIARSTALPASNGAFRADGRPRRGRRIAGASLYQLTLKNGAAMGWEIGFAIGSALD
jgi:hypothetical protein